VFLLTTNHLPEPKHLFHCGFYPLFVSSHDSPSIPKGSTQHSNQLQVLFQSSSRVSNPGCCDPISIVECCHPLLDGVFWYAPSKFLQYSISGNLLWPLPGMYADQNSCEHMSDVRSCTLHNIVYLRRGSNTRLIDKFTVPQPRPPTTTPDVYTLYSIHNTVWTSFKSMQSSNCHTSRTALLPFISPPSS
jgi:hypothetical protein